MGGFPEENYGGSGERRVGLEYQYQVEEKDCTESKIEASQLHPCVGSVDGNQNARWGKDEWMGRTDCRQ
jgi:hypothetical protein